VKFIRLATNSLLSGLFFSLLLAILLADLNINAPFSLFFLIKLTLFLMLTYGLVASLLCLLVSWIHRFFAGEKAPLEFVSLPFLTLSFSLFTLLFLLVFRENFVYFGSFFIPGLKDVLKIQIMVLFATAVAGLVLRYQIGRQKARRSHLRIYFAALGAAVIFALIVRFNFPVPDTEIRPTVLEPKKIERKVTLISFEGLSLDILLPLMNERKLPNFAWLMESGCWGRLRGFTPSDPFVLERTLGTGKLPGKHRQISAVRYQVPGLGDALEVVPRFILFRQLTRLGLLKIAKNDAPSAVKDIWGMFEDCAAPVVRRSRSEPSAAGPPKAKSDSQFALFYKEFLADATEPFSRVRQAFYQDAETEESAFAAREAAHPQLFSLVLNGAIVAEMYFYKFSFPDAFGDIRQEEIQKNGAVIEKYYQFYDQLLGKYLASLKEDELFIAASPYGTEPLPFWKRIVEWMLGNTDVSSYHEQAPDGVVFLRGRGIVRGKFIDAIRLVDLAPTILYFVGLPVGRDMDGLVRGILFEREFADENPVQTISSYEEVTIKK